jgi:hypothetical protein
LGKNTIFQGTLKLVSDVMSADFDDFDDDYDEYEE